MERWELREYAESETRGDLDWMAGHHDGWPDRRAALYPVMSPAEAAEADAVIALWDVSDPLHDVHSATDEELEAAAAIWDRRVA